MINLQDVLSRIGTNVPMTFDSSMSVIEYLGILTKAISEIEERIYKISNVPIYSGEWADHYTYEPFSIVSHENNGYMSLKPVPQKINIENKEYWLKVSSFNPQLEKKLELFINETLPEVGERQKNTIYLKVTNSQTLGTITLIGVEKV